MEYPITDDDAKERTDDLSIHQPGFLADFFRVISATAIMAVVTIPIFPAMTQGHWRTPPIEVVIAQACVIAMPIVTMGVSILLVLRGKRKLVPILTCGMLALFVLMGAIAVVMAVFERAAN